MISFLFRRESKEIKRARAAGVEFVKIYFGEHVTTGRSGYGDTYEEAYNYASSLPADQDLYGVDLDTVKITRAWKCFYKQHPTIVAWGMSKDECVSRLLEVMKHITGVG